MKRYLVFANADYYPFGGWDDLKLNTDDYEEAKTFKIEPGDWLHVVDLQIGKVVFKSGWLYHKQSPETHENLKGMEL